MRALLIYIGLGVLSLVINFMIYIYSFNAQATPFLHEEQRVESAILMFKTTLPLYVVSAVVITILFYAVARAKKKVESENS